jgi:shikimate kinase
MTKPKRIFVVGHMGAGKALLSEALAKNWVGSLSMPILVWNVTLVEV